jgi:hypothetical protein
MIVDCAFRSVVPDNCALGLAPVRTLTLGSRRWSDTSALTVVSHAVPSSDGSLAARTARRGMAHSLFLANLQPIAYNATTHHPCTPVAAPVFVLQFHSYSKLKLIEEL